MEIYITFGQKHMHSINGTTLDEDCVVEFNVNSLKAGHEKAMEIFNGKFSMCNERKPNMRLYPRGIIVI